MNVHKMNRVFLAIALATTVLADGCSTSVGNNAKASFSKPAPVHVGGKNDHS